MKICFEKKRKKKKKKEKKRKKKKRKEKKSDKLILLELWITRYYNIYLAVVIQLCTRKY